jgi:hypothetical protein
MNFIILAILIILAGKQRFSLGKELDQNLTILITLGLSFIGSRPYCHARAGGKTRAQPTPAPGRAVLPTVGLARVDNPYRSDYNYTLRGTQKYS